MKILMISILPVKDYGSWSGILYSAYKQLSKNYEVQTFYSEKAHRKQKWFARISHWKFRLIKERNNVYFNPSVARIYGKELNRHLEHEIYDLILCMGSGIEMYSVETQIPAYLVADANYSLLRNSYKLYQSIPQTAHVKAMEVEKRSLFRFDKIFYTSQWALNATKNHYTMLTDSLNLINFGANLNDQYTGVKRNLPNNTQDLILLAVGTDAVRKGLSETIKLAESLDCTVDWLGLDRKYDKSNNKDVQEMISEYEKCHFLLVFSEADCTPIVINEAGCYGLPTLAYDVGGIGELIHDGVNGFIVDSTDHAAKLIKEQISTEDYTQLCSSTRNNYEQNLSWEVFERKLLK